MKTELVTNYRAAEAFGDTFCYWCAVNGKAFALAPNNPDESSIAAVAAALHDVESIGYGHMYVIWQPKNHSSSTWNRWQKKWTNRTKKGTV